MRGRLICRNLFWTFPSITKFMFHPLHTNLSFHTHALHTLLFLLCLTIPPSLTITPIHCCTFPLFLMIGFIVSRSFFWLASDYMNIYLMICMLWVFISYPLFSYLTIHEFFIMLICMTSWIFIPCWFTFDLQTQIIKNWQLACCTSTSKDVLILSPV